MYYLFRYIVKSINEFEVKNIILITLYKTMKPIHLKKKRIINNIGKF